MGGSQIAMKRILYISLKFQVRVKDLIVSILVTLLGLNISDNKIKIHAKGVACQYFFIFLFFVSILLNVWIDKIHKFYFYTPIQLKL